MPINESVYSLVINSNANEIIKDLNSVKAALRNLEDEEKQLKKLNSSQPLTFNKESLAAIKFAREGQEHLLKTKEKYLLLLEAEQRLESNLNKTTDEKVKKNISNHLENTRLAIENIKKSNISNTGRTLQEFLDEDNNTDNDKSKKLEEAKKKARQESIGSLMNSISSIGRSMVDTFTEVLGISFSIANVFKDAGSMLNSMTTASMGTSLITDAASRERQMKYGLSGSQNFALAQTMGLLGMSSDEDLMYMNTAQQELFTQYMQKYSAWYDEMSSSGMLQDIQQMRLDFAMTKQELSYELLGFIANNKDLIIKAMGATVKILECVVGIVNWLSGIGSGVGNGISYNASVASDLIGIGSSTINSRNNNINLNMTNNASGVLSSQDQLELFFAEQMDYAIKEVTENYSK